jgi:hypothetical protein
MLQNCHRPHFTDPLLGDAKAQNSSGDRPRPISVSAVGTSMETYRRLMIFKSWI